MPERGNALNSGSEIEIVKQDGIAVVRLGRPRIRSAITLAMWEATATIFQDLGVDESVRAVLLTVEEPDLSVDAHIGEFSRFRATSAQSTAYEEAVDASSEALARCPKPVIAVISGYCLGGACNLAMACDFRFAAPSARFDFPAARLSFVHGVRSTDRLRNLVGMTNAKRLLYTAEQFDGAQALDIGFVDHLSDDAMLDARRFADSMARNAPLSISGSKLILNGLAAGNENVERLATLAINGAAESDDFKEGMRAAAEKRQPVFRGR
jgi:enoyl-CoA hydratase/carnithine racemase